MKIEISRKDFLRLSAGAATLAIVLPGCDEEGSDDQSHHDTGSAEGGDCTGDGTADIASNHGHDLTVPNADIVAGMGMDYDITGSSSHSHTVTLSDADMADLAAGMSVTVTSSSGGGHNHVVTILC